jgi:hypothetical protein
MGFEIAGRLHTKNEAVEISERFRKREFVLEIEPESQYPQTVQFELTGDRCELLDNFEIGQNLKVEFSLRGREWTSPKGEVRFFNSLLVWQVQGDGKARAPKKAALKAVPAQTDNPPPADDSIPF